MYLLDAHLSNEQVIIRCDYNVPLHNGKIMSTKRIDASLPTLQYILSQPIQRLVIISHLGRPKGIESALSLLPIKQYLETILQRPIKLTTLENFSSVSGHPLIMIENIRFYKEETKHIESTTYFRLQLSQLGTVFINDAFGCCHREHSSIIGIHTPKKYMGLLIQKELSFLSNFQSISGHKTLIIGGSKVIDKISLLKHLLDKVDTILIGGGMAFAFLVYHNHSIGDSIFNPNSLSYIEEIYKLAEQNKTTILLPTDFICNQQFSNEGQIRTFTTEQGIPSGYMGLDIGLSTVSRFKEELANSQCIVWNGPLGVTEFEQFATGSYLIMKYLSTLSTVTTIIGGGDTASCCEQFKLEKNMSHVSTGGGASLALLEGNTLPGIEYLMN